jgi:hypothetical protein
MQAVNKYAQHMKWEFCIHELDTDSCQLHIDAVYRLIYRSLSPDEAPSAYLKLKDIFVHGRKASISKNISMLLKAWIGFEIDSRKQL